MNKKSYFRPAVDAMKGYTPGDQPKLDRMIKLNTNENPYPPSPAVTAALQSIAVGLLRRYPDPAADMLRDTIASLHNVDRANVIAGNGSDDILTMIFRAFTSKELKVACLNPTYSLYTDLAAIQEAEVIKINLAPRSFAMPEDILEQAAPANLLLITRPNAPTGNSFPLETMELVAGRFDGMVVFDEAYADFAVNDCMLLATRYSNVIVMRTLSKSYALAGLRLGYAVAQAHIIAGLMKLKDSYNLDSITQAAAAAALKDRNYFESHVALVRSAREELCGQLRGLGFEVVNSETNFLFARPPGGKGREFYEFLRERAVFVRYFPAPETCEYVRITVGTPGEMEQFLGLTREFVK